MAAPGNSDVHVPPYEPDPEGGAGAGGAGALGADGADGAVGDRIVVLLSTRAQAVANGVSEASNARSTRVRFMVLLWAIPTHNYKHVCALTELCVQHPEIGEKTRI